MTHLGDAPGSIRAIDPGRLDDFPQPPGTCGLERLEVAAASAVPPARARLPWSAGPDLDAKDLDLLAAEVGFAVQVEARSLVGHRREANGTDGIVAASVDDATRRSILRSGGGLLLHDTARVAPQVNILAGDLAVAARAPVEALALLGSEPTRALEPQVARTVVVPLEADVIVHPTDGAPFDLSRGSCQVVEGYPRIAATGDVCTLLLVEKAFGPWVARTLLARRAQFHPLLRLDAPADPFGDATIYGLEGPRRYRDVLVDEVRQVREHASDELVAWWWLLGQRLAPVPFDHRGGELAVRGRFPGGVGIVPYDDGLVVRAGGSSAYVPESQVDLLEALVGGGPVTCPAGSADLTSAIELARVGLVIPA